MRLRLIKAGRQLFAKDGYEKASTPHIVKLAGVTRGALYHHFKDKKALFRAVVEAESTQVAEDIRDADASNARDALFAGSDAFFNAMAIEGRVRILLVEGPRVLGVETMASIDAATGANQLKEGLQYAKDQNILDPNADVAQMAMLLSAGFDRAALAIADGQSKSKVRDAINFLIERMLDDDT
ncbi:MAG: TetR/AcrR family transcriptional regulator [Pseudomonadota bacterium]